MSRKTLFPRIIALVALVFIMSLALGLTRLSQARMAASISSSQQQPAPLEQAEEVLPAVLESTSPAGDESWISGPLTLTFNQELDAGAADFATISPELAGDFSVDGSDLIFTPGEDPEAGTVYTIRLDSDAMTANGKAIGNEVTATFSAATPLLVTSTEPSDGSMEINTDSQIVIAFNRPVVALSGVEDQDTLPTPLALDPPVEGNGRWVSTSVFTFQPETAFAGSTEYSAVVEGITDITGIPLAEPYHFSFTTAAPLVDSSMPTGNFVRPDTSISVQFTQPMDQESTEQAFSLSQSASNQAVDGEIGWQDHFKTLTFTPTEWLDFGATYLINVQESAKPYSKQGTLRSSYSRTFTIVPTPVVDSVSPVQGAQEVSPDESVIIRFNAPVSPTLVSQNVTVTPLLTTTQVFSYYSEYMNELQLSWFKEPNTTYTVTIGAEIGDEYGNTLPEDFILNFTTGDYPPFVRLETEQFTHFTAYSDTRISLLYRNVDTLNVDLYRLPEAEFFKLTGPNQWEVWQNYQIPEPDSIRIWSRDYEVVEEPNIAVRQVITLTDEQGNDLPPGMYFVQVSQPNAPAANNDPNAAAQIVDTSIGSLNASQSVVIISNDNLVFKKSDNATSLAWLTDLKTGQPVADVPIAFFNQGTQVAQGQTSADGTLTVEIRPDPDFAYAPVIALAGEPGDENFAVVSSDWSEGIAIWDFNLFGGWTLDMLQSYFYTDRPIYRPGQTVYWKGIIRALVNDRYELPSQDLLLQLTVRDPMGNAILEEELSLNELGSVNGAIELTSEALTGSYYMEVRLPTGPDRFTYAGTGFMVAAYTPPEFEISLRPGKEEYSQGETVTITLQADYFSGGPLANAPVTWRLVSQPYTFVWEKGPQDRYFSFQPFDPDQEVYDPYSGSFYLGLLREGTGMTAADGRLVIEVPADISMAPQSQYWTFDVTVQSPNNEFVSTQTTLPVHKADFYIGISPDEYVGRVNESTTIDFVTVTPLGDPYPSAELNVVLYEYRWNSVYARAANGTYYWETNVERTPVFTTTATTDESGAAAVEWTPIFGGQYQIAAQSTDERGNNTTSSTFLWISPENPNEFVAWPRENNDRIELVTNKRLYEPGETAKILVPSPFSGPVEALLTIERSGIVSETVITLNGNSETLELPITEDHIPNFFVSIVIVKGIDETNPIPAMRIGYVQLNIDTSAKELALDVETSGDRTEPGATVAYTMTVSDAAGDPVPNTEVSVAVVDKAVLSLAMQQEQQLVDIFYYQRPLGILTSALLTKNLDRMSAQLSEGAKGGGGGDGAGFDIRSDFLDIAYWQAELMSDEEGIITFSVDLPDNLTTWRLVAKGVTEDTLVGDMVHDVIATKELQVRPLLPRFYTAGDAGDIGVTIVNASGEALEDGVITVELAGARFIGEEESPVSFELEEGATVHERWPIGVDPLATQVIITMTAEAKAQTSGRDLNDAQVVVIPIKQYIAPESVATAGQVLESGTIEAIQVPTEATNEGELVVNVEPSLAAGMANGLTYLRNYPFDGTEQIISRFLPNVFTARAAESLGIDDPKLVEELDLTVNDGVQRLVNRQNQDGGWGYWPGERSSVFLTAYALWGLVAAQEAGYTVPDTTIQDAIDYIERSFVAPDRIDSQWQLNEISFMLYVLSEIGHGDPGRTSTLFEVRERLGTYGKALLAMTLANLQEGDNVDPRIDTILDDLYGAATMTGSSTWWQEDSIDYRNLNSDTRTTAMVLDAFVQLDPEQPILANAVRWLMNTRTEGHWHSTQETAWSLIALTDWLLLTGETDADYDWTVLLNESELGSGTVTSQNAADKVILQAAITDLLRDQVNTLRFSRDGSEGEMYYTADMNYAMDAAEVNARDHGIVVERQFALAEDEAASPIDSAIVGDVISVTLTIVAPTDLFHLKVEVPIPAGTVPIDPNLATTSDQFVEPQMTLESEDQVGPTWWRYWMPTYTDMQDDKVTLFATFLSAGTYEYTFNVRATLPGEYNVLPAYAEQIYFPDVWGRSDGTVFTIGE